MQAKNLPERIAATDCKSLCDLITRTATPDCAEYRTQHNARAIKDLISDGVELRWAQCRATGGLPYKSNGNTLLERNPDMRSLSSQRRVGNLQKSSIIQTPPPLAKDS